MNLTSAQDALTRASHRFTLRRGLTASPCGFSATGGVIAEGTEREKRWACTITLPARTTLELRADEEVTIDEHLGRVYRIVHAPGPNVMNLERQYGAVEI